MRKAHEKILLSRDPVESVCHVTCCEVSSKAYHQLPKHQAECLNGFIAAMWTCIPGKISLDLRKSGPLVSYADSSLADILKADRG